MMHVTYNIKMNSHLNWPYLVLPVGVAKLQITHVIGEYQFRILLFAEGSTAAQVVAHNTVAH